MNFYQDLIISIIRYSLSNIIQHLVPFIKIQKLYQKLNTINKDDLDDYQHRFISYNEEKEL